MSAPPSFVSVQAARSLRTSMALVARCALLPSFVSVQAPHHMEHAANVIVTHIRAQKRRLKFEAAFGYHLFLQFVVDAFDIPLHAEDFAIGQ